MCRRIGRRRDRHWRSRWSACRRRGMASRALTARLRMAFSSALVSTLTRQSRLRAPSRAATISPRLRRNSSDMSDNQPVWVDRFRGQGLLAGRRPAAAGSTQRPACRPRSHRRDRIGVDLAIRAPSSRRCCRSRLPMMTPSMLLKSWAMPPVNWPTASIFWACRAPPRHASLSAVSLADPLLQRSSSIARRVRCLAHRADPTQYASPVRFQIVSALLGRPLRSDRSSLTRKDPGIGGVAEGHLSAGGTDPFSPFATGAYRRR